jgi:hypothetical protein
MPGFTVGTYDVGADNKENLLAAINAENGTNYSLTEFRFTDPKRVTLANPMYNTSIKLGPLAATGMVGFKTIYYNRIHASDLGPLRITWQNEGYLTELLPRLSQKYGIALTPDDVYEQVIIPPVPPETEVSITLNFRETSVAYYGGSYIVLGDRDPSLEFELPENLPFRNDMVFFVNHYTPTKNGNQYLESSVLSVASDKVRNRTMNVTNIDPTAFQSLVKNTYTKEQALKLNQFLPFVFTWRVDNSMVIRGVNIYGDVVEINETSNHVEKITNVISVNVMDSVALLEARDKVLVREGTQGKDGSIYLLVGNPSSSTAHIHKSQDFGMTFTEMSHITQTNMATFNYTNWESVVIHDMVVVDNKLSVLVTNPNTYGTHPTKSATGPAVEEFDLVSGASDYFPINPEFAYNTEIKLSFAGAKHLRFVSAEKDELIQEVVAVGKTAHTNEDVLVYCFRESGQEYRAEIMPTEYMDYAIYGITAFSKPLTKDVTGKFVAVEVLTMVPTGRVDDFFLLETGTKSEHGYMGFGAAVISGCRKAGQISGWTENFVDFGGGSEPAIVTMVDKGKRSHYYFSGGNGILDISYEETAPNVYTSHLDTIFGLGSHSGFNVECDIGNATHNEPRVTENLANSVLFGDYPSDELYKLPIGFSFIAKHKVTGNTIWVVAEDFSSELEERTFGGEYRHLGEIPIATFSDSEGKIYVWTKHQGVYSSDDQGNTWVDYARVKSYYKHPSYLGAANVDLKPGDFRNLSVLEGITFAELQVSRSMEVFNIDTLVENYNLVVDDRLLYRIDATEPTGGVGFNSNYLTNSLNLTSDFSPRKLQGWDIDKNNNVRAAVNYVEDGVDKELDQLGLPDECKVGVITTYSDVGFLGIEHLVLTKDSALGANLWLVKDSTTADRVGLQFATTPQFGQFDPLDIIPLWEGNDDGISYTPVMITSKSEEVLIIERDGLGGNTPTITKITIDIPGDNGKPLQWIPMFNSNRFDVMAFQEDNGIFKVSYGWDGPNTVSLITLDKYFSTDSLGLEMVYSGCIYNQPNVEPYSESEIGPWPAAGTVLGDDCQGFTKREKRADGFGGYYWTVIETNSADCGFVAPTPGNVGYGGGNFNIGG